VPSEPGQRQPRAFDSLLVFVFAWLWLSLRAEPPVHSDMNRELAFARDLVDGAELYLHGPWASFAGLVHGTAWIDLLALCQRCGFGITGIDRVITTLLASAVSVMHLGVARLLAAAGPMPSEPWHARIGPLAGALAFLATLPATCQLPILWQPSLLPVAIAFAHVAMWRLLARGALLDGLALGLFCALAFDIHVIAVVWFAVLVFAAPLAGRRPGLTTLASIAAVLVFLLVSSPELLSSNLEVARAQGWLLPGLSMAAVLVAAGRMLRSRFAALSLRRRLELAVVVEVALAVVVMLASRLPGTPTLMGRYLLPFGPGVVLLFALLISHRGGSRVRTMLVSAFAILLLLASVPRLRRVWERSLPLTPTYSYRELEAVAHALASHHHTWTELVVRLQGPDRALVLGGLASMLLPGDATAPAAEPGLLMLAVDPADAERALAELPSSTRTVALERATVLLIETTTRLDRPSPPAPKRSSAPPCCSASFVASSKRTPRPGSAVRQ
jgi:hypothetical protein